VPYLAIAEIIDAPPSAYSPGRHATPPADPFAAARARLSRLSHAVAASTVWLAEINAEIGSGSLHRFFRRMTPANDSGEWLAGAYARNSRVGGGAAAALGQVIRPLAG